jgi:hypothetical protein
MQDGDFVVGHERITWLGWETIRLSQYADCHACLPPPWGCISKCGISVALLWLLSCCATPLQSALLHLQLTPTPPC